MKTSIEIRRTALIVFMLFALIYVALSTSMQAVVPAPDGGYFGGNTAEGQNALLSLIDGTYNTAVGLFSLQSTTGGSFNTATGAGALLANSADENTATGAGALLSNSTGVNNTADGAFALFSNTIGSANTANGVQALFSNTNGFENTATGFQALANNTEGSSNTAVGFDALHSNSTGAQNTATGNGALQSNTGGIANTAVGFDALLVNTTGGNNTAIGPSALGSNTTGIGNIALGFAAGGNVTTANNVIAIGHGGLNVDNSCFIGNIRESQVGNDAVAVMIDAFGKLGTTVSSRQFKKEIRPMDKASEDILALKPVSFRYKKEIDPAGTSQFGLVAEEVEKVNPALVVRDKEGKPYSVRYDQVNAMLLNEFLKEHRKVEEQQATIGKLKSTVAQQQKGMEALTSRLDQQAAQIQKVSAQIELSGPAPEMVLSNP